MYRKVLIGFESTKQGRDALELGRVLARAAGARMLVASIAAKDRGGRLGLEPGAERLAAYVSAHLHELELAIEGRYVKASSPAAGLAKLAEDEGADLIVVGSTHRGPLGRILPGGTAERLLGSARCAVAVAPRGFSERRAEPGWQPLSEPREETDLRVIGVGYDGSAQATAALAAATELALRNRAALRVFAVAGAAVAREAGPAESAAAYLQAALAEAVDGLPSEVRAEAVYLRGRPADALAEESEGGLDLLVLGSRGAGPLRRALGSVSGEVMRAASCPVLIAPNRVVSARPVPVPVLA